MPKRTPATPQRKLSTKHLVYLLLGGALLAVGFFHLAPAILTGLVFYVFLDQVHRHLTKSMGRGIARYAALAVFLVVLGLAGLVFVKFVKQSLAAVPVILAKLIPTLNHLSDQFGFDIQFDTIEELQQAMLSAFRQNLGVVKRYSLLLTKEVFTILLGGFAAVFYFLQGSTAKRGSSLYAAVGVEMERQVQGFLGSFGRVMGAQLLISAINTALTAVFLTVLGMPYVIFLVLTTFLAGLLPIIGNLISNSVILGTALTVSPEHALFALAYLVVIHKGEYFLNSKIVGSNVEMPMWKILLAILIGETTLGLAGIPLAPAILHFIRREMQETKA